MCFRIVIYLCLSFACVAFSKEVRIIGGIDADIREFPHLVSIRKVLHNRHFCGGSIITAWHILTAGHCFLHEDHNVDKFIVYTGTSNSSDMSGPSYRIAYITIHPKYIPKISKKISHKNDIAILTVRQQIKFNELQNKAQLPVSESKAGQTGYLSGWGYTSYPSRDTSQALKKAKMTIFDHDKCSRSMPFVIHEEHLCVFQKYGVGSCIGDSGCPLTISGKVVGISSFNLPCATGVPDIYTDVYNYMDFILPIIKM